MTKIYIKLITMSLALLLSISLVIMSSYAWLVLSGNPAATGIQITIGGSNTIMTAPNVRYRDEKTGIVYNYPGRFSNSLNFSQQSDYAYLQELGNLTPVSTSNGVDWFLPTYYSGGDDEVREGKVPSGALRDVSRFHVDSELTHANLAKNEVALIREGSYVYLDFWVVAPGGDYKLHVSTDMTDGSKSGSFVIDMMQVVQSNDKYVLEPSKNSAAAAVRIGFLANDLVLIDDTMLVYNKSKYFDNRFTKLKGMYQEPNSGTAYLQDNRFTIYEPNGDYHPAGTAENGYYVETRPLGLIDGKIQETRTTDNLTVQKTSTWAAAETGEGMKIQQQFTTASFAKIWTDMNADTVMSQFYNHNLQGQIASYVDKGGFLKRTDNLYSWLDTNGGRLSAQALATEESAGATDDVYIIQLERNVPQRIRMFVWIEGQDIDCVDDVNSAQFAVNIELAGGNE